MATKQGKKDNRLSDKEAMHLAEITDVSPKQAKDLAEKHGKEKGAKEAKNFKAEGGPRPEPRALGKRQWVRTTCRSRRGLPPAADGSLRRHRRCPHAALAARPRNERRGKPVPNVPP